MDLVRKGSISEDGLLVVKENFPMEIKHTETIVIPRDFATSIVTLIHNDPVNNHPSMNQMKEITKRRYYIFRRDEIVQKVNKNCLDCTARKKMKSLLTNLETQTESVSPGTYCNADVLVRNKQKILLVRDNLTSFT